MKPKPIYWIVFLGILAVGAVFSLRRLLPIYNATVFLLALVAFWNAISLLAGWLPGRKEYTRKHRLALAVIQLGLGAVWMVFSMTSFANQAVPMLLASLTFVGAAVVVWWSAQP